MGAVQLAAFERRNGGVFARALPTVLGEQRDAENSQTPAVRPGPFASQRLVKLPSRVILALSLFIACPWVSDRAVMGAAATLLAEAQQAAHRGESRRAIELATQALQAEPELAEAYYVRGRERFRVSQFAASVADFDQLVKLTPARGPELWERGIACYYAGQFREGAAQFSAYQGFDDSDVENAVWHVLCISQLEGLAAARRQIMPVKRDARIPMQTIYALYRGDVRPSDVLQAVERAELTERQRHVAQFYAHLYLGLYFDVTGQQAEARQHLSAAADKYRIEHYMWDVARVHAARWRDQDLLGR